MAVSYSKIRFLLLLSLIFNNEVLSQTLNSNLSTQSDSDSSSKNLNSDLINSLKNRLHSFGSVNLPQSSDETEASSEHTLGSESEDNQSSGTETSENPPENKTSHLEELLSHKSEQHFTGAYKPRDKEFSVPSNFENFLTKKSKEVLEKCTKTPHEFVLVVDESGSISTYNWSTKVKDFVLLISSAVAQVNSYNKLSIVQYSREPKLIMDSSTIDKLSLRDAAKVIDDMFTAPRTHGTTYTGAALEFVREKILDKQGQFVLELSESTAPLSKKNKVIILLTDGGSKDPEKALRESLIHRFNGVDLFVFGVGKFNEAECRKLVGCSPQGECHHFFHANWESILEYLQKLVVSMCRDIGRNATCLENWSEFSECSAKCGGGIMKSKLLNFVTVAEATVGEDGIKGLSCEEQYRNVSEKYERCNTFPCTDHLVNINEHSTTSRQTRNEENTHSGSSEFDTEEKKPRDPLEGELVGTMRTVQYGKRTGNGEVPREDQEDTLEPRPLTDNGDRFTTGEETSTFPGEEPPLTKEERPNLFKEERDTRKLSDILKDIETARGLRHHNTEHHVTHHHPHTRGNHAPVSRDHVHHHHSAHPDHPDHTAHQDHSTHSDHPTDEGEERTETDGGETDLTNLAGFDGTGRVPFHLIGGKDHNDVKIEKVLDEEEESQLKEHERENEREKEREPEKESNKQTNNMRRNERTTRDQDSQTEKSGDESNVEDETEELPRTRDSSTNTVNMEDASTNTLNTADAATNTVQTRDSSTNTEKSSEPETENAQETIKKHVPRYKKPTDHHPHHTTDLKEVAKQAENAISTTKMKFKRFLENDHVRKLAAVAIVIFLSALSISVFSYIFLREKEPTPHLFDPSDQEFMNAGDGDDVEPSENYQVSNMEDGIWA